MQSHRRDSAWSDDSDAVTRWLGPPPGPARGVTGAEPLRPDVIAALSSAADSCLLRRCSSRRSTAPSCSAASSSPLLVAHRSRSPLLAASSMTAPRSHPACLPHVVYSDCLRPMPVSDCSLPLQTAGELAACRSGGGGRRRVSSCDDPGAAAAAAEGFPPPPNSEASASVASDRPLLFLEGSEASAVAAAAAAATSPAPQPRPPLAVAASFPRHYASAGPQPQPHAPPSRASSHGGGEPSLRAHLSTSTASLLQELRRVQHAEDEAAVAAETSVARHLSATAAVAEATPCHHNHHHHHHRRSFGGYPVSSTAAQPSHAAVAHRSSRPLQQLSVNGINNTRSRAAAVQWGCGGETARWAEAEGEAAEEVVVFVSPERALSPGCMVGPAALSPVRSSGGGCNASAVALLESKLLAAQRTLRSRSGGRSGRGRRRSSGGDDLFW